MMRFELPDLLKSLTVLGAIAIFAAASIGLG